MTNIYVANLEHSITELQLRKMFEAFGKVLSAKIITDRETGYSRGFGFVEMESAEDAKQAMGKLNGKDIEGKNIAVSEARERKPL